MAISIATPKHATAICSLVQRMHAESKYADIKYDQFKVQRLVNAMMHDQGSVILIATDLADEVVGFLALEQSQYLFNFDHFVTDLGFYVLPNYRTTTVPYRLIKAGEAWAAERGDALVLGVSAPEDTSKTAAMYGKLGYKPWGTVMRKGF